jgi:hypothetical protein
MAAFEPREPGRDPPLLPVVVLVDVEACAEVELELELVSPPPPHPARPTMSAARPSAVAPA